MAKLNVEAPEETTAVTAQDTAAEETSSVCVIDNQRALDLAELLVDAVDFGGFNAAEFAIATGFVFSTIFGSRY